MKKISYILYKYDDIKQDLKYIYEFKNQNEVKKYIKKYYSLNNVKDYITSNINILKPTKHNLIIFKNKL